MSGGSGLCIGKSRRRLAAKNVDLAFRRSKKYWKTSVAGECLPQFPRKYCYFRHPPAPDPPSQLSQPAAPDGLFASTKYTPHGLSESTKYTQNQWQINISMVWMSKIHIFQWKNNILVQNESTNWINQMNQSTTTTTISTTISTTFKSCLGTHMM